MYIFQAFDTYRSTKPYNVHGFVFPSRWVSRYRVARRIKTLTLSRSHSFRNARAASFINELSLYTPSGFPFANVKRSVRFVFRFCAHFVRRKRQRNKNSSTIFLHNIIYKYLLLVNLMAAYFGVIINSTRDTNGLHYLRPVFKFFIIVSVKHK